MSRSEVESMFISLPEPDWYRLEAEALSGAAEERDEKDLEYASLRIEQAAAYIKLATYNIRVATNHIRTITGE